MVSHWYQGHKAIFLALLVIALTFVIACGSAAAPAAPAAPEVVEKEVIVEKEVLKEIPKETVVEKVVVATPTPIPASQEVVTAKVDRVIYAFGEVQETNRHWTVGRPSYYQFDPYTETLIGLDPQTNERIPRLAKSWEWTPDGREWTFFLEEDVPFHFGWGEFTADDVVAAFERHIGDDSQAGSASFFRDATSVEAVNDHEVKFTMKSLSIDMPAMVSRGFGGGEFLILSQNQISTDGLEGFDEQPAGTGSYEYGGRKIGESIWFNRIDGDHWRGETPDFPELEIKWVREDVTRLASLLTGELHIASLSRELQLEAAKRGMQTATAGVPTNYLVMFFGGLYFADGDEAYDPTVPWADPARGRLIRQAMNKAINREEMLEFVLRGEGEIMYNTAYHPVLGQGYNPEWEARWDEMYGYDPDAATELMRQAGFGPENPMEFTVYNYVSSDEPETPVMVEALINYWEPIGVQVNLLDSEWGTVRKNYRGKTDFIKKGGWGNVITMRSLTTRLRAWSSTHGTSRNYETNLIDANYQKYLDLDTLDQVYVDNLIREMGDERYDDFADIPFFWFSLSVMFNPDVVESWTFPGTSGSKTSHWDLIKAAQ